VKLGGAIELHAAFCKESRISLPSLSAAQEIRESEKSFRGFPSNKTTPRELFGTTVIAKPLKRAEQANASELDIVGTIDWKNDGHLPCGLRGCEGYCLSDCVWYGVQVILRKAGRRPGWNFE